MDTQMIINTLIMLVAFFGGWFLRVMWQKVNDNDARINQMEILVAGTYVKREEFEKKVDAMFTKLDKISEKIDSCRTDHKGL